MNWDLIFYQMYRYVFSEFFFFKVGSASESGLKCHIEQRGRLILESKLLHFLFDILTFRTVNYPSFHEANVEIIASAPIDMQLGPRGFLWNSLRPKSKLFYSWVTIDLFCTFWMFTHSQRSDILSFIDSYFFAFVLHLVSHLHFCLFCSEIDGSSRGLRLAGVV